MRFGPVEIGLILVIILIIFGAGKLPEVGRSMGKAIHGFKQAQKDEPESPLVETVVADKMAK